MAFQQFKLTKSVNQTRGIFDKFIYNPDNNDLVGDVLSVGYFDDARYVDDPDWVGSVIEISASDGYAIGRIADGGVVTLYNSTTDTGLTPEQEATLSHFAYNPLTDQLEADVPIETTVNSLFLGEAWSVSSAGQNLGASNLSKSKMYRVSTLEVGDSVNPTLVKERYTTEFVAQPIDTSILTNPSYSFLIPPVDIADPEDGQSAISVKIKVDPSSVLTNFKTTTSINGVVFIEDVSDLVPLGGNLYNIIYQNTADLEVGDNAQIVLSSIDGDVVVLGDDISGVPYLEPTVVLWDRKEVAFKEDIPVWGDITGTLSDQTDLYESLLSNKPANVVYVNEFADMPAPISDVIYLDINTHYVFGAFINFGNVSLNVDNAGVKITGLGTSTPTVFYTGASAFIKGSNIELKDFILVQTQPSVLLDIDAFDSGATSLTNVFLPSANSGGFGAINNGNTLVMSVCGGFNVNDGIKLTGSNWVAITILQVKFNSTNDAFVGLDITGTVIENLNATQFETEAPSGAVGLKGDAGNINIISGSIASFNNGGFIGGITPLDGITIDDIRYSFFGNSGLMDSTVDANPYLTVSTTVAVSSPTVYYKVNQGNWSFSESSRLQVTSDGDIINMLETPIKVQINGSVTVEKVGGGSNLITARLVYNDLPNDPQSSITGIGTNNNSPTNISLNGLFILQPNDSVSMYVANQNGMANIIVDYAKFSILRVL